MHPGRAGDEGSRRPGSSRPSPGRSLAGRRRPDAAESEGRPAPVATGADLLEFEVVDLD
ncbi:hypothetical protein [Micrococcus luteus]|uniref:hypothetical protein n=1 Tax=Micrococcus luteus TaxID=1270 RepID=UPI00254CCC06|nr:hypothetical protein [Micrococcus luteus]MDK8178834.1 hypothetical protein [Micrococcus luteus]